MQALGYGTEESFTFSSLTVALFLGLATLAQPNCSIAHLLFLLLLPDSWHLRWFNNAMEQSKLCSSVCCSLAGDCVQFSVWFALLLSCRFLNYGLMNIVSVSTVLKSSNRWTSWWLTGVFLEITSTTFSPIFRMYYQFLSCVISECQGYGNPQGYIAGVRRGRGRGMIFETPGIPLPLWGGIRVWEGYEYLIFFMKYFIF